jgi:lysophospholipase L1-like esterase
MMGLVSATLTPITGQLATSTGPGVLVYRGRTDSPEPIVTSEVLRVAAFGAPAGKGRKLLALGDSWIRFQEENQAIGGDFRRALAGLGYDTDDFDNNNYAYRGWTLAKMAGYKPSDDKYVYARLRKLIKDGTPPLAVLVSGGGNDFVDGAPNSPKWPCGTYAGLGSKLEAILNEQSADPQYNDLALQAFLNDMKGHLTTIVRNLADAGKGADGKQLVPIIVVAYDHPIPDGRAWQPVFTCPWLRPVFARKIYDAPDGVGQGDSSTLMATFITGLNEAYGQVATDLAKTGILVRHVPLTGVLAKHQSANHLDYKAVWKNELHPTKAGFEVLARHLDEEALKPLLAKAAIN